MPKARELTDAGRFDLLWACQVRTRKRQFLYEAGCLCVPGACSCATIVAGPPGGGVMTAAVQRQLQMDPDAANGTRIAAGTATGKQQTLRTPHKVGVHVFLATSISILVVGATSPYVLLYKPVQ